MAAFVLFGSVHKDSDWNLLTWLWKIHFQLKWFEIVCVICVICVRHLLDNKSLLFKLFVVVVINIIIAVRFFARIFECKLQLFRRVFFCFSNSAMFFFCLISVFILCSALIFALCEFLILLIYKSSELNIVHKRAHALAST